MYQRQTAQVRKVLYDKQNLKSVQFYNVKVFETFRYSLMSKDTMHLMDMTGENSQLN